MLQEDRRGLRIWPVDLKHHGSRAFSIDKAVVCCLDQMLPLCHGVKGIKEGTGTGDVICRSGVKNPIMLKSICRCHIDHDHRVWRRVRDRVRIYDRDRVRMHDREEERLRLGNRG